ncbi:ChaC-like protein [Blastocladiella britannica]|nr:ChaC-like protein [Blastocladiella britannica]
MAAAATTVTAAVSATTPVLPLWIFGYGSLIWKVDFPVEDRMPGFIKGYVRRFWQASHDHRGTPETPGRVVTLLHHDEWVVMDDEFRGLEDTVTWGMAYRVPDADAAAVLAHLDHREKDGYSIDHVQVYASLGDEAPRLVNVLCYIGKTSNPSFRGHQSIDDLARIIATTKGPSGPNCEYLLNLAHAMRQVAPGAVDHHLFALERRVLELQQQARAQSPQL